MSLIIELNSFDPDAPEDEPEEHPYKYLYPHKVMSVSDILKIQQDAVDTVLEWNANKVFPDDAPIWNDPKWISETEPEPEWPVNWLEIARRRHVKEMERIYATAVKQFPLGDFKIDRASILLGICSNTHPDTAKWLLDDWNREDTTFLLLGTDIGNMSGHVPVVRCRDSKIYPIVHPHDFYILPPSET